MEARYQKLPVGEVAHPRTRNRHRRQLLLRVQGPRLQ